MPDIGLRCAFYDNIYMAVPVHIVVGVGHHETITYALCIYGLVKRQCFIYAE